MATDRNRRWALAIDPARNDFSIRRVDEILSAGHEAWVDFGEILPLNLPDPDFFAEFLRARIDVVIVWLVALNEFHFDLKWTLKNRVLRLHTVGHIL